MRAPLTAIEPQVPGQHLIAHDPAAATLLAGGVGVAAVLTAIGLPAWWVTPLAAGAAFGLLAQRPR